MTMDRERVCRDLEKDLPETYSSDGNKRTNLEKRLLFLAIILGFVVLGLAVALLRGTGPQKETCTTPDCVKAAARIITTLDTTVDPCEDFYAYACGTWKRENVIPDDKSSQTVIGTTRDDVQIINKYLLEDRESFLNIAAIQKARDMFASCVNTDLIDEQGNEVVMPLLEQIGGWPVLGSSRGGNWNESGFDLVKLLVKLRAYNNYPLVEIYVQPDVKDTKHYLLYLDQPNFGLPGRGYYINPDLDEMRKAYVTLATDVAKLFGANSSVAEADMREMFELETDIANISMPAEDRRDNEAIYNKMTLGDLKVNFTEPQSSEPIQFSWFDYVTGVMSLEGVNITINESEPIVVRAVPYYRKLFDILRKYSKRTVANYVVWYIMRNRISNLPSQYQDLLATYSKVLSGTSTQRSRWRICEMYTGVHFSMAIGHMFISVTFDPEAKSEALDMIHGIRKSFNELLEEIPWMKNSTKVKAKQKADAIREWIGYPDDLLDVEKVNELYEQHDIKRDDYFGNVLRNLRLLASRDLSKLRDTYDKNKWTTPPSAVNAYYSSSLNSIMFPAGIFQSPFYEKGQPKSMNYGAIGVVVGHEITHGFDDRGRQYDKDGNLAMWWDDESIHRFKTRASCIVDQYGKFVVPEAGLNLNGINTQGENIADNGGLKQSYRAYRKWVERQGHEEAPLPGVSLSHDHLFFVSFAQVWCNNMRKQSAISSVSTGVHSPGQFRVIGTLQNSQDFARVFKCANNSFMNPQNKCSVW